MRRSDEQRPPSDYVDFVPSLTAFPSTCVIAGHHHALIRILTATSRLNSLVEIEWVVHVT